MFTAAWLMTQVLSDSATTVLLGPIAVALADSLGLPAIPFVVCTALGAVVAFLTPIGHHGNLLILGPGQYRFADFLRIGAPLTILLAFVCAWMTQRSEEHTSELQSLMRISYAVLCLKKNK